MKIALILTGFMRKNKKTLNSLKQQILDKYDTDIYISSWDTIEKRYNPHADKNKPTNTQLCKITQEKIINQYKEYNLKKYVFHNYDDYYKNRFENIEFLDRPDDIFKKNKRAKRLGSFWVERLRDQWTIVKNGFDLIDNKQDYDIFLKIRSDIFLYNIKIHNTDKLILSPPEFPDFEISDYFAYGNLHNMNCYCTMIDHIKKIYTKHNINIAVSEELLYFYLKEYCNIDIFVDNTIIYKRLQNNR